MGHALADTGFIKVHILHHAAEEEVYGLALIAVSICRRLASPGCFGRAVSLLSPPDVVAHEVEPNRVAFGKVALDFAFQRRDQ